MSQHFPVLVVVVPLIAAFVAAIFGWIRPRRCMPIAALALAIVLATAIGLLIRVLEVGPVQYRLGGWPPPIGIEYRVDHLNAMMLVLVAAIALGNLIATVPVVQRDFAEKLGPFHCLYLLFCTGLLGVTVTGDAFNLFVLLEITSLTTYALISMGSKRAPLASLNYMFMGTVGASFYLLGVGYLYLITGSLNMYDIARLLPPLYSSKVLLSAFVICMTGLYLKMALFPLHSWLPQAYVSAPAAVASLMAPLTTKVMIYAMIRIVLFVFTPAYAFTYLAIAPSMVWLASIAIVAGSVMALAQKSLRRMLVFVIVSEVGYMVGGFWLGNRAAMTGAILHLVNDAAMTFCVFLAVGCLTYRLKSDEFEALRGVFERMPFSMAGLIAGGIAFIGIPPTCGFFSKWYLIKGGLMAGHWGFVGALLFSSLMTAIMVFRIIECGFFDPSPHGTAHRPPAAIREAPPGMVISLLIAALVLVALGLSSGELVTRLIEPMLPGSML